VQQRIALHVTFAILLALLVVPAAMAGDYDRSIDCSRQEQLPNQQRIQCAGREMEVSEFTLTKTYNQLLSRLDPEDRKSAIEAQKAWMVFRDTECGLSARIQGFTPMGSMYGLVYGDCATWMNSLREKELASYLRALRGER
jgi:uncharacterized protein YecT (DUF1311 family)